MFNSRIFGLSEYSIGSGSYFLNHQVFRSVDWYRIADIFISLPSNVTLITSLMHATFCNYRDAQLANLTGTPVKLEKSRDPLLFYYFTMLASRKAAHQCDATVRLAADLIHVQAASMT